MKELSVEEKARRYDEAIKRLEDIETGNCQKTFMFTEGLFDYIFPELRESEDERIRKKLIVLVKGSLAHTDEEINEMIAYLEKQAQKPAWSKEDKAHIDSLLKRLEGMCKPDAAFISTEFAISEDEDWLKSLRPQSHWKPSDEQMKALEESIMFLGTSWVSTRQFALESLYQELKKLMKE